MLHRLTADRHLDHGVDIVWRVFADRDSVQIHLDPPRCGPRWRWHGRIQRLVKPLLIDIRELATVSQLRLCRWQDLGNDRNVVLTPPWLVGPFRRASRLRRSLGFCARLRCSSSAGGTHQNTIRPHSSLGYRPPALEAVLLSASPLAYASPRRPSCWPPAAGFSLNPWYRIEGQATHSRSSQPARVPPLQRSGVRIPSAPPGSRREPPWVPGAHNPSTI
jgi:hypothetical protein